MWFGVSEQILGHVEGCVSAACNRQEGLGKGQVVGRHFKYTVIVKQLHFNNVKSRTFALFISMYNILFHTINFSVDITDTDNNTGPTDNTQQIFKMLNYANVQMYIF